MKQSGSKATGILTSEGMSLKQYFPEQLHGVTAQVWTHAFDAIRDKERQGQCDTHVTIATFQGMQINDQEHVQSGTCYINKVPTPLQSIFKPTDQLLDTNFHGPDKQLSKLQQSSPTIHSETLWSIDPMDTFANNEHNTFKMGVCNNMPCPRCMANLSLSGMDVLSLFDGALKQGWSSHRSNHIDLSIKIAKDSGMCIRPESADKSSNHPTQEKENGNLWLPYTKPRLHNNENPYLSTIEIGCKDLPNIDNPKKILDFIRKIPGQNIPLNTLFDYHAGIIVEKKGKQYLARTSQCLPPGITPDDYINDYKPHEIKYSAVIPPVTSLLILLKQCNFNTVEPVIYTTAIPTMRDMINAIGGGITHFIMNTGQTSEEFHDHLQQNKDEIRQDNKHQLQRKPYKIYAQNAALYHISQSGITLEAHP